MKFEFLTAMKMWLFLLWAVMPCRLAVRYHSFGETLERGRTFLRNMSVYICKYTQRYKPAHQHQRSVM
jgi:hypothetical protein